jgi:hypothetical protein
VRPRSSSRDARGSGKTVIYCRRHDSAITARSGMPAIRR